MLIFNVSLEEIRTLLWGVVLSRQWIRHWLESGVAFGNMSDSLLDS